MEPYVAQIILFPYSFAPSNFAFCEGQTIAISQNQALYTLIGTTYGGNGTSTFLLPDLREKVALGTGQGPGLSNYVLGQTAGTPSVTVSTQQMPSHNHQVSSGNIANVNNLTAAPAAGSWIGPQVLGGKMFSDQPPVPGNAMYAGLIANSGGSQPHDNMQPFIGLHYCIALYGIFPTQN